MFHLIHPKSSILPPVFLYIPTSIPVINNKNTDIWKSEIFGRSLDVIVQEGIQAKLAMMPEAVRYKLCQTLSKIINKGSSTMIAIVI